MGRYYGKSQRKRRRLGKRTPAGTGTVEQRAKAASRANGGIIRSLAAPVTVDGQAVEAFDQAADASTPRIHGTVKTLDEPDANGFVLAVDLGCVCSYLYRRPYW